MTAVNFNLDTLHHYENSHDDMEKNLADTTRQDFTSYADIILHFDDKMNDYKKRLSGEEYRHMVGSSDHRRREIHNNCLHDIDIMNRLAKTDQPPQKPFANFRKQHPNRTEIGEAILFYFRTNMHKNINKAAPEKENSYAKKRDLIDKYNHLVPGTRYPLLRDKQGNYGFYEAFTFKRTDKNTVISYVKQYVKNPKQLTVLNKAANLISEKAKPILTPLPKADTSMIKDTDKQAEMQI